MKIEIKSNSIHTGWRYFGFDKNNVPVFGRVSYNLSYTNKKGERVEIPQHKPKEYLDDKLTVIKTIEPEKVEENTTIFNVSDIIQNK